MTQQEIKECLEATAQLTNSSKYDVFKTIEAIPQYSQLISNYKKATFIIEKYSPKAYILKGDTFKYREQLNQFGVHNKYRRAYFIKNEKLDEVITFLKTLPEDYLIGDETETEKTETKKPKPKTKKGKAKTKKPKAEIKKSKEPISDSGIAHSSPDTLRLIFSAMSLPDILASCSLNKYYSETVCNDTFWKLMIAKIEPKYHFSRLPLGYHSWKLLYMTLYYYYVLPPKQRKVAVGAQISLEVRKPIYRYVKSKFRIYSRFAGVVTGIKKVNSSIKEIQYYDFFKQENKKLVARGKRMIDPEEYKAQKKKDVRNLVIQGYEVSTCNQMPHKKPIPCLVYPNGQIVFYVGQIITYFPFRHVWYHPNGSSKSDGPGYEFEVTAFKEGQPKLKFLELYGYYGDSKISDYDYKGKSNPDTPEYMEDILLYDPIEKKHYFKKNKFNESFVVETSYTLNGKEYKDTDRVPLEERFYVESIGNFK